MPTAAPSANRRARQRGRVAAHDPEALLKLMDEVARAAVRSGEASVAESVSMAVFNTVKLDVDRARGIADPEDGPERTPSAQAIQLRFKELAGQLVPWPELLSGALRPARERVMWLAALRREDARDDLTDEGVTHALQLVAHRLGLDALAMHEYTRARDELVQEDKTLHGEEGVLERVLPTGNQVLAHCGLNWNNAARLAGLSARVQPQHGGRRRPRPRAIPGMPAAHMVAFYAALNGRWPSRAPLLDFASKCAIRMSDPAGSMAPIREEAGRLLRAEGIEPPGPPKALGKGKRLTYRHPVNGIPGAPLRDRGLRGNQLVSNPRMAELHDELAVISLRVWLAGLSATDTRTRAAYLRWQVGTGWKPASAFDKHDRGGFTKLKQQALDENARVRQLGEDPLTEALARADVIRAEVDAVYAAGAVRQVKPVPFGDALRAVLAGPHAEALAPKQ